MVCPPALVVYGEDYTEMSFFCRRRNLWRNLDMSGGDRELCVVIDGEISMRWLCFTHMI